MHEDWAHLKKLQVMGDSQIFIPAAKDFIERSFRQLLKSRGVENFDSPDVQAVLDENFELLPDEFKSQKQTILDLMKTLKKLDEPVDWYNGEFIDHGKIQSDNEMALDLVLNLFQPRGLKSP